MTAPAEDTDVGGIVAHLRIHGGSEWERDLQRAQRQAEALGRVSPTVRISSNAAEVRAQLDEVTARLQGIARLNPDVRIRTNNAAVQADLAAIRARLAALGAENTTLRLDLTTAQAQIEQLRQRTGRQGGVAGRDFGAQFTRGLRETLAAIPDIAIDGDTSDVDRQIQEVRAQLDELSKRKVGVDITAEDAMRSLAALQGELQALRAQAGDIDVRFNTAAAAARLARLQAQLGAPITPDIDQGRFASKLAKAIKEASAALPKIDVDADSTPAQRELAEIRARLVALGEQKIGVDISAAEAMAKMKALQGELDRLSFKARNDMRIRVDTAAASAKLAALQAQMSGLAATKAAASGGSATAPLIIGAIVAAASLAGPLVATATAGTVALAGAVGAAVLAYKGLKQAATDETRTGLQLKGEVKGIGAELGQLQTIAANRAAPGVLGALGKIREFIPSLAGPIAGLSAHLGNALNIGTGGTIKGLRVMMPLLDDAGRYAEGLAQKWANFTASPRFSQFIDYARRELPIVGSTLGDIGSSLVHVGVALQPYGDQLLHIIDLTAKATSGTADLLHMLNSNAESSGGDNSDIFGFQKRYQNSKDKKDKGALDYVNIALGAGNPYADPGKAKAAAAQSEVAAIQSAQAQEKVALYMQHAAQATKAEEAAQQKLANRYGVTLPVMQAITEASRKDAETRQAAIAKMQQEGDAAGLLKAALDELDGKQMAAAEAQNAFEQSLVSSSRALESQKEAAKGQSAAVQRAATSYTGLSEAAIANRGALLGEIRLAETAAGVHGNLSESSVEAKKKLGELRQQLIDNAVEHGASRKEVDAYVQSVLDINKLKVEPTKPDFDDRDARIKANEWAKYVTRFPKSIRTAIQLGGLSSAEYQLQLLARQRTARINVVTTGGSTYQQSVGGRQVFADGGTVQGIGGPREDKELAWVSPGEEIIRNGPAQKHRALLKAINAGKFADGGTVGGLVTLTPRSSSTSAAAKAKAAKAKKPKEIILTLRATAGGGSAYGIASYIKGQVPSVREAARLLSLAVDDAFTLKGMQARVAGIRASLQKLRDQQSALRDNVTGKLAEGSDPGQFGSIQQYTAYLQAKTAQNLRYKAELKKLDANKAIPDDLLAKFAADGPSAALDSFAGANRRDVTALLRASSGFNASVTGGSRQAASIYGPAIAKDTANLNKALAQSARTEAAMVRATLALARIVNRPVTIKLDGKTVATTKYVDKELQGVVDELRNVLVTR